MKFTKAKLEKLYATMSLSDLADHLGMAKSTLYYHMRKLGVKRRSKSEAQSQHLKNSSHQRKGKKHSDEVREKISEGTRRFWESSDGEAQKEKLGDLRRKEWNKRSAKQRKNVIGRLKSATRPAPGELSKFGTKLVDFLSDKEEVSTGIKLTPDHVSDIILESRRVVIELLLPIGVYGEQQEKKVVTRYDKLIQQLNDEGYRVVVIEDKSNSISNARCQRVYDELMKFFQDDTLQRMTIVS
jgi:hypothetical protein